MLGELKPGSFEWALAEMKAYPMHWFDPVDDAMKLTLNYDGASIWYRWNPTTGGYECTCPIYTDWVGPLGPLPPEHFMFGKKSERWRATNCSLLILETHTAHNWMLKNLGEILISEDGIPWRRDKSNEVFEYLDNSGGSPDGWNYLGIFSRQDFYKEQVWKRL